jgi:hypothetical protein
MFIFESKLIMMDKVPNDEKVWVGRSSGLQAAKF